MHSNRRESPLLHQMSRPAGDDASESALREPIISVRRALASAHSRGNPASPAIMSEDKCRGISSSGGPTPNVKALPVDGSAAKCSMFAASLQLTLDYDALIETDSHNDDQQEDKNDYREDDGTTLYRDRPRSRKAADEGKMQGAMTACGTSVWTGRALQVGYDGLEIVRALDRNVWAATTISLPTAACLRGGGFRVG